MRKLHAFLFAFLLLFSLASATRLYSRLEFTIADSEEMGAAAVFNENAQRNFDCAQTETVRDEKLVLVRSGISNAFNVSIHKASRLYYRTYHEGNSRIEIIYYKPSGARCYYWLRNSPQSPAYVGYVPREAINFGQMTFASSRNAFDPVQLKFNEWNNMGDERQDDFGFSINGSSRERGSLMFIGGGQNRNELGYGRFVNNQRVFEWRAAPFMLASGSRFRSMDARSVVMSIFVTDQ